jgi:hypothetical protein
MDIFFLYIQDVIFPEKLDAIVSEWMVSKCLFSVCKYYDYEKKV